MKCIPVTCLGTLEKYDGKSVLFQIERDGELVGLKGVFRVLPDPSSDSVFVDIEYRGVGLEWLEPPNTLGYQFHLSKDQVASIKSSSDPQLGADWLVGIPFEYHRHIGEPASGWLGA